jgi:biopolymer transport protein ExbD
MSLDVGSSKGGVKSESIVTPLGDVVLVLLIIFMIVIPMTQVGYAVNTPPKVTGVVPPTASDQLIVRMDKDGRIFINKEAVAEADFSTRFREVIRNRENKIVFFAADGELLYDKVATLMDLCRDNGAKNIGIVFDDIKATASVDSALGAPAPATPPATPQ